MTEDELFNKIVYARSYFLFWNPIVNKFVGTNDTQAFGDINRARLLLVILNEINKNSSNTH
jgi:hypothetical protein